MAVPRVLLRVEIPVELSNKLEDYIATSGKTKTAVTITALEEYLSKS